MFKSCSLDFKAASIKDLIWIEAALFVDLKMQAKLKEYEINLNADIRAILKDVDDVQRIKATGKASSVIKWSDLPSQQKNKVVDNNKVDEVRKAFLKELSNKYIKN